MWEFGALVSTLYMSHGASGSPGSPLNSCKIIVKGDEGFCLCVYVNVCARESDYMSCVHIPAMVQKNLPHLWYIIFLWRHGVGACILKCRGLSFPHYSYYPSPHPPCQAGRLDWPSGVISTWVRWTICCSYPFSYLICSQSFHSEYCCSWCSEPACTVLVLGNLPDLTTGGVMGWSPVHVGL